MATEWVRDRDAPITAERLIFRVYGYNHPPEACVCDVEYAPQNIYMSKDPRAIRTGKESNYFKFYKDAGLKFVQRKCPQYMIFHQSLRRWLVGLRRDQTLEVRRPEEKLRELIEAEQRDVLIDSIFSLLDLVEEQSNLSYDDFGVFGSLLHGFHSVEHSDIDLVVYGREETKELMEVLREIYSSGAVSNEFEHWWETMSGKQWPFSNLSFKEFLWHGQRKMVYGLYDSPALGRRVKFEFEPVKKRCEKTNEYDSRNRVTKVGWVKVVARVTSDEDAAFIPSIYGVEVEDVLCKTPVDDIIKVVSYVEEFRLQARKDERILVEGNLERVDTSKETFHQVTLSLGPKYYDQVLRVLEE